MFTFLVFLSAFLLEGIGTYVSVVGLGALFAYSMVVMIMAVALDIAKVVTVTFLYRHWKEIGLTMKSYMLVATFVLMVITSSGVFGYLSGEFQRAIASTSQQTVLIQSLDEEKVRLQKRKEEIDKQIAQLPQNNVRGRRQLMQQFGPEVTRLNDRLAEIDKKLPDLKMQNIEKNVHVGPIMYVAEAFNTTPQEAVKWVIFTIIGVFDPLAIALLVAGNFLLERGKKKFKSIFTPEQRENAKQAYEDAGSPNVLAGMFTLDKPIEPEVPRAEVAEDDAHAWEEVDAPVQPTIQQLIDKPDNRKFEVSAAPLPEAIPVAAPVPEVVERDKVVIKAPPKKPRTLKVQEADGKEVITLTPEPPIRASLENVTAKGDVISVSDHNVSNSLRTYRD